MNTNKINYLKTKGLSKDEIDRIMKIDAKTEKLRNVMYVIAGFTGLMILANYVNENLKK